MDHQLGELPFPIGSFFLLVKQIPQQPHDPFDKLSGFPNRHQLLFSYLKPCEPYDCATTELRVTSNG
jgi:hypothetical protein